MSQETSAPQSLGCDEAGAGEGQAGAIACHFIAPSDRELIASLQMQPGSSPTRRSFAGAKWGKTTRAGNLGLGLMFSSTEFPNIILKSWLDTFIIFWNSGLSQKSARGSCQAQQLSHFWHRCWRRLESDDSVKISFQSQSLWLHTGIFHVKCCLLKLVVVERFLSGGCPSCVIFFNPHLKPQKWALSSPFCKWGN